ncbi:hypothetical protein STEG23_024639, partial [Scotinomys teguina]
MQDILESYVIRCVGVLAVRNSVERCWEQLRNFRGWEDISVDKEQEKEKKSQTVENLRQVTQRPEDFLELELQIVVAPCGFCELNLGHLQEQPVLLVTESSFQFSLVTRATVPFNFAMTIQNANDVLIAPLEKFRKEQIGAAK